MSFSIADIIFSNHLHMKYSNEINTCIYYYNGIYYLQIYNEQYKVLEVLTTTSPFTSLEKYGITLSIPIKLAEVLYK